MKKSALLALILLTGCASYSSNSLALLPEHEAVAAENNPEVLVNFKTFNKLDCDTFLGRDVISEGYVPVQVLVRNNSKDALYLSPTNFNVPLAPVNQVADKVHTSTAGRVIGYGVGGLFIWPLLIPAVYDGIKSSSANDSLDADYDAKALKDHTIQPHSSFNGVVFIPKQFANDRLEMFLVNQTTKEKVVFQR